MTDMGTAGTASAWTVTNPGQPETRTNAQGQAVRGMVVSFQTDRGWAGTVFVTNADYTADKVKAAIAAEVANIHGIADLTG